MPKETLEFDAVTVPLEGSNLIEASAGTGKTYSIALMVLRLLLKHLIAPNREISKKVIGNQIFINQILMVTFTNAAVSELEIRIRKFVKEAFAYSQYLQENENNVAQEQVDKTIVAVVDKAVGAAGLEDVLGTLKDNLLLLDEANISTIHGFCQSILSEFSLETNQQFGVEIFTDTPKIIENEINKFWRKYVTVLPSDILRQLGNLEIFRTNINKVVTAHLDGKDYWYYDDSMEYTPENLLHEIQHTETLEKERKETHTASLREKLLSAGFVNLIAQTSAQKRFKQLFSDLAEDDFEGFLELYNDNISNNIGKTFPAAYKSELDTYISDYVNHKNGNANLSVRISQIIYCAAIQKITKGYEKYLFQINSVTYGDLITKLYQAVTGPSADVLRSRLLEKYKAVFVDEFQDTDRQQYEIFENIFAKNAILFLIGDPKQSIYAWRKADMATYFLARQNVQNLYTMNVNYRSSQRVIDAMNHFFLPVEGFDTFSFGNAAEGIFYQNVGSPVPNTKPDLFYDQQPCRGISIYPTKSKSEIPSQVGNLVLGLLTDEKYAIGEGTTFRKILPSDIGILVRQNREALEMKSILAERGIASIVIDESKVLRTEEATDMLYLLQAMQQPSSSLINKVLLSGILEYDYQKVTSIDQDKLIGLFQEVQLIWQKNGIYPAVTRFFLLFDVEKKKLQEPLGERSLTNLQQLTELLSQMEHRKKLSQDELVSWLQRGTEGLEHIGDEYEMRIESDEKAVQIVTIHKAKGLQYILAITPCLDMTVSTRHEFVQFHDGQSDAYLTKELSLLTPDEKSQFETEQEQENRRLLYVAVTRAEAHCFVFHITGRSAITSLTPFWEKIRQNDGGVVSIVDAPISDEYSRYQPVSTNNAHPPLKVTHFELQNTNWRKLSFTGLSYHGDVVSKERSRNLDNDYDRFVFDQLRFGAASGNLLHDILEKIDFRGVESDNEKSLNVILQSLKKYWSVDGVEKQNTETQKMIENLSQLLHHIVQTPINIGNQTIYLKNVTFSRRRSEMEFDFPISSFDYEKLRFWGNEERSLRVRSFDSKELQGLMNGKIDLFFEYQGRYYILDWKSNYLGFNLPDYDKENVQAAMQENNYHLQYLIYTIAANKMLKSIMPDFDYEKQFGGIIYLFLRGVRKDKETGIFTTRPSYQIIQKIEQLMCK